MLKNWLFRSVCFAPDGASAGGATTVTGGAASQQQVSEEIPKWAKDLYESNRQTSESLRTLVQLASQGQQRQQQQPREPEEPDLDDAALEALPRARFAELIANKTVKHLEKTVIEPLKARLNEVTVNTTQEQLRAAVDVATKKYPDFMEYKDAMIGLSQQASYASLPPEDLYLLAKTRAGKPVNAPEKTEGTDGKPPAKRNKITFGGLQPNSADSGTGQRNQKMSASDAINAAWDETVATLGGEPAFEE